MIEIPDSEHVFYDDRLPETDMDLNFSLPAESEVDSTEVDCPLVTSTVNTFSIHFMFGLKGI